MVRTALFPLGVSIASAALAAAALTGSAPAGPAPPPDTGSPRVVLLELFTSQGCSSCPPADRLLTRLASSPQWRGRIVPLAFHVDYWNYIGWRDPFSSPAWSERQQTYARVRRNGRVYTPQAMIDGRIDLVGSDESRVLEALADAASDPGAELRLAARITDRELVAEVEVRLPPRAPAGSLDLLLAVFEMDLETPVGRGENAGRTLHNDRVVRRLERVARLDGRGSTRHRHTVPLDEAWTRENLGVAVFVQDAATLEVWGAAETSF